MSNSTPENDTPCNGLVILPPADQGEQAQPNGDPPPSKGELPPATLKRRHLQAVEAAHIYTTPPTLADIVYIAREFVACTLPHSDPGDDVLAWSRTNGNYTLAITSGINAKTGKPYGIPYGIIPRLLLAWIVTEIKRTKSQRLEFGDRFADFLLKLGLDPRRGGTRSDARRTREQIERLFNASLQFVETLKGEGQHGSAHAKINIGEKWQVWWSDTSPEQGALWGSYIIVSKGFFDAVMKSANPLDLRVLKHVKDSSLGIDLYTILNREAFLAMRDDKPRFLAWEWLMERTGNEYTGEDGLKNFRRYAIVQIKAIMAAHSGLIIKIVKGRKGQKSGLEISHLSRPSIPPEEPKAAPTVIERQARPAPALSLVPPPIRRPLKPSTVGRFRALYPRHLSPYICQDAFDAWQAGLAPENKARHYDAAFLGFAESWAKGK